MKRELREEARQARVAAVVDQIVARRGKGRPPEWFPDWKGDVCVIVASGPSAKDQPLETARGRCRFIAVNDSWKLCPWADMLYACDYRWWKHAEGWQEGFRGLRVSLDVRATVKQDQHPDWNVQLINCRKNDDSLLLEPGLIGWGANSGFGAINIAAQLEVRAIILVGFDMSLHAGLHWHGSHPPKMGNPREIQLPRWRRAIDNAAPILERVGIKVYNTSPITGLKAYEKVDFATALSRLLDPV